MALFAWTKSGKQLQGQAPTCAEPEEQKGKRIPDYTFGGTSNIFYLTANKQVTKRNSDV